MSLPSPPSVPLATPRGTRATLPVTLLIQSASSAALIAPTVAAPRLLEQLHASSVFIGIYVAVVYFAAMLSSQWGATLVRRWGPIRTSQAALFASAVGVALVATAQPAACAAGAVLIGLGYGPITPASSEMLARSTSPQRYALVFSIKQSGVPLGGVIAALLVPPVLEASSAAWALACIAALCLVSIGLASPLRARLDGWRDAASPLPSFAQTLAPLRLVLGHPGLRRLALCSLVFSAVQVSLTAYAVTFLNVELGWGLIAAGGAMTVSQVAGAAGRVAWGWFADRRDSTRATLLSLAAGMAVCGVSMLMVGPRTPHAAVVVLLAAYGATAIGWNGVYLASVARRVPHDQAAAATAGSLFLTFFGVVIVPPLFGALGSATGSLGIAFAALGLPLAGAMWALRRDPLPPPAQP
ncbi:MAG: MFS transporter [Burkholderiaceae bacterium]